MQLGINHVRASAENAATWSSDPQRPWDKKWVLFKAPMFVEMCCTAIDTEYTLLQELGGRQTDYINSQEWPASNFSEALLWNFKIRLFNKKESLVCNISRGIKLKWEKKKCEGKHRGSDFLKGSYFSQLLSSMHAASICCVPDPRFKHQHCPIQYGSHQPYMAFEHCKVASGD